MKSYYYICTKCMYETAVYGEMHHCPNCHMENPTFQLLGTSDEPDIAEKLSALRLYGVDKVVEQWRH